MGIGTEIGRGSTCWLADVLLRTGGSFSQLINYDNVFDEKAQLFIQSKFLLSTPYTSGNIFQNSIFSQVIFLLDNDCKFTEVVQRIVYVSIVREQTALILPASSIMISKRIMEVS